MIIYVYLFGKASSVSSPVGAGAPEGPPESFWAALWRFQRALGRLQEVLEGFWAANIDLSLILNGFGLPEIAGDQF